jgi:hypothetical protein
LVIQECVSVVELIGSTKTDTGLKVTACLDKREYELAKKFTYEEIEPNTRSPPSQMELYTHVFKELSGFIWICYLYATPIGLCLKNDAIETKSLTLKYI